MIIISREAVVKRKLFFMWLVRRPELLSKSLLLEKNQIFRFSDSGYLFFWKNGSGANNNL
jgi:hypothetical protein